MFNEIAGALNVELGGLVVGVEHQHFVEQWEAIPPDTRKLLLSNVWCGKCRDEVAFQAEGLYLQGHCQIAQSN